MFASIEHGGYIFAAFVLFGLVLIGLIGWVAGDYRNLRRTLGELERRGLRRRSETAARQE